MDEYPYTSKELVPTGKIQISEEQFSFLEEKLENIEHRAKYYGEHAFSKTEFLDLIGELKDIARTIRKTANE